MKLEGVLDFLDGTMDQAIPIPGTLFTQMDEIRAKAEESKARDIIELNKAMMIVLDNLEHISTEQLDALAFSIWTEQSDREQQLLQEEDNG